MVNRIIALSCAYHLGGNVGVFSDFTWVGERLSLPFRVEHRGAGDLTLLFQVRDVDVWQEEWLGHPISLDDELVGHLRPPVVEVSPVPPKGAVGILRPAQIAVLIIPRSTVGDRTHLRLGLAVDRQSGENVVDDFVLERLETVDWVLRPGW
jgi:hypothetical protein